VELISWKVGGVVGGWNVSGYVWRVCFWIVMVGGKGVYVGVLLWWGTDGVLRD